MRKAALRDSIGLRCERADESECAPAFQEPGCREAPETAITLEPGGQLELSSRPHKTLTDLEEEFSATDERDEIVQFIRQSQRGIIKRFSKTNGDEGIVD